jgi:hypothetical protein
MAVPQKAKKAHFFHMNKNIVNITLASPINPYIYHIQDGAFGYVAAMNEFHNRYVKAVPTFAISIIANQSTSNLPRFLLFTCCGKELSNVSGIVFFSKLTC